MAGFIPEKKIFKVENGVCYMQDGRTVDQLFPVGVFVEKHNNLCALLDSNEAFLSYLSRSLLHDPDLYNKYMSRVDELKKQIPSFPVMLEAKAMVAMPDPDYFMQQLTNSKKTSRELAMEFSKAIETSITSNKTAMMEFGVRPTHITTEKKKV